MVDALERGREAFGRRAWGEAYALLSAANRDVSLEAEDLERLAVAAHLVGKYGESADGWTRAHHAFLAGDNAPRAARCAFWLALFRFLIDGDLARSSGWVARGQRLLDEVRLAGAGGSGRHRNRRRRLHLGGRT